MKKKSQLLIDPETGNPCSLLEVEYLTAEEILKKYPRRMINPKTYVKLKQLTKDTP